MNNESPFFNSSGKFDLTFSTLAVVGANGTMGRAVSTLLEGFPIVKITGDDENGSFSSLDDFSRRDSRKIDVVIDFSLPEATLLAAEWCAQNSVPFVSGTTGLSSAQLNRLRYLSDNTPILHASNFSIGIAVLRKLVGEAASMLHDWDAEVVEAHHRRKVDAPSGTAITLGHTIANARNVDFEQVKKFAREGRTGPRQPCEIGFQAIRGGNVVGEHTVFFLSDLERIELTHRASSRSIFASGAIQAANWILGKKPGWYSIDDIVSNL